MSRAPATGPTCVIMGITMMLFGLPFFYPAQYTFAHYQPYFQMGQIFKYAVWGLLFVAAGLWRVLAAIFGSYRARTFSTATAISVWCFLFLNFLIAAPSSPGVTVFGGWILLETWTLFRIRRSGDEQKRVTFAT